MLDASSRLDSGSSLDDLRQSVSQSPLFRDEPAESESSRSALAVRRILSLTAPQRFGAVLALFLVVLVLGTLCLLAAGRIALPF